MPPLDKKTLAGHAQGAQEQALNRVSVQDRLRAIMREYDLSREQLATVLNTPIDTLKGWLDKDRPPPRCLEVLLNLIEQRAQVRTWVGIHKRPALEVRGRPFKRGNPYRFKGKR